MKYIVVDVFRGLIVYLYILEILYDIGFFNLFLKNKAFLEKTISKTHGKSILKKSIVKVKVFKHIN